MLAEDEDAIEHSTTDGNRRQERLASMLEDISGVIELQRGKREQACQSKLRSLL